MIWGIIIGLVSVVMNLFVIALILTLAEENKKMRKRIEALEKWSPAAPPAIVSSGGWNVARNAPGGWRSKADS